MPNYGSIREIDGSIPYTSSLPARQPPKTVAELHHDSIKYFFASPEKAQLAEIRAKQGDDRAQNTLGQLFASVCAVSSQGYASYHYPSGYHYGYIHNLELGSRYLQQAYSAGNFHAQNIATSVAAGNRSILTPYIKDVEDRYRFYHDPSSLTRRDLKEYVYYRVAPGARIDAIPSFPEYLSSSGKVLAPVASLPLNDILERVVILEVCARAGDAQAAKLLRSFHNQERLSYFSASTDATISNVFNGIFSIVQSGFMQGDPEYKTFERLSVRNPQYDTKLAAYWDSISSWLSGKGKPPVGISSLEDLQPSTLKTPERLYNLGWANVFNKACGDISHGIDLLKHAANLGNNQAARLLGEIYENYDLSFGTTITPDPATAYFWYREAAEAKNINAAARCQFLEKAFEVEIAHKPRDQKLANPRDEYALKNPLSMRTIQVSNVDLRFLREDTSQPLLERVRTAAAQIEEQIAQFNRGITLIQDQIEELKTRVLSGQYAAADLEKNWRTGADSNAKLTNSQIELQTEITLVRKRFIAEAAGFYATLLVGSAATATTAGVSQGASSLLNSVFTNRNLAESASRFGRSVVDEEKLLLRIAGLEDQHTNLGDISESLQNLRTEIQRWENSHAFQSVVQDKLTQQRILIGYTRLALLRNGEEAQSSLQDAISLEPGLTIETLLKSFSPEVNQALTKLCLGIANTRDCLLISAQAAAGNESSAQQALRSFGESVIWKHREVFFPKAAHVDVLELAGLTNFSEDVELSKTLTPLQQEALQVLLAAECGLRITSRQVDRELFALAITRHGKNSFYEDYLTGGTITDLRAPKKVILASEEALENYIESVTRSYLARSNTPPLISDNLFLRLCAYEYLTPLSQRAEGSDAKFRDNPATPIAFSLANNTLEKFVSLSGFLDIEDFNKQSKAFHAVFSQSCLDFFAWLGNTHSSALTEELVGIQRAFRNDTYITQYDRLLQKVQNKTLQEFPQFVEVFSQTLQHHLLTISPNEAKKLQLELAKLPKHVRSTLKINTQLDAESSWRFTMAQHAAPLSLTSRGRELIQTAKLLA